MEILERKVPAKSWYWLVLIKTKFPRAYFKRLSRCVFWVGFLLEPFTATAHIPPSPPQEGFYGHRYAWSQGWISLRRNFSSPCFPCQPRMLWPSQLSPAQGQPVALRIARARALWALKDAVPWLALCSLRHRVPDRCFFLCASSGTNAHVYFMLYNISQQRGDHLRTFAWIFSRPCYKRYTL